MSNGYPAYIFGMHDRGGEHLMLERGKRGWVLVTEALGSDPNNHGGSNYTDLTNKGLGVIVRLNYGYGTAGTIPNSAQYDEFARRCGNFVQASPGCNRWVIGNEMNLAWERPGGPEGQVITPQLYAVCFKKCRDEIRRRPGHAGDQVIPGAVGPWNTQTTYAGNFRGDWVKYFADMLDLIGQDADALTIHTYTHGQDPGLVFSDTTMNAPFQNYHWHFRAYRDFLAAVPADLRNRPVYLTETDQYGAWRDANTGWVRNAYQEINNWSQNRNNQPIQALVLFRWIIGNPNDPQQVGWAIENKPQVQDDFRDAMQNEYRVVLPESKPEYLVAWLQVNAPTVFQRGATSTFSVRVRNDGRRTWLHTGSGAVRMGYRWVNSNGRITQGLRTNLPQTVAPGQTVTVAAMTVQAPAEPGLYTLELDLVEGATSWFGAEGSPVWRASGVRVGPRYRVAWLNVPAPTQGKMGEVFTFPVRLRNEGSLIWPPSGPNPVNLSYKWLDVDRNVVVPDGLRTSIGQEVSPLEEITLNATVQFPSQPGPHILQMDMVQEFVTWFQWKGSPVRESPAQVESAAPDYAAQWFDYAGPERLAVGQTGSAYLEIRNIGSTPWPGSGDDAVGLGYRWLDAQGQQVPVGQAKPWPLPKTIEPGDVARLRDVEFMVPQVPGAYRLVWDLVQDGEWLSEQGVAVLERPMQIVAHEYAVEWELLDPWPAWMPPGQEQRTSLSVDNIGTRAWTAGGEYPVHLAYHWFTQDGKLSEPWDTFRIRLPHDVLPGASADLIDVVFKTPAVLGNYVLRWDLVEEGWAWFFRHGAAPLELPVEVSDRSLAIPWTAQASHNPDVVHLASDNNAATFWDSKANQEPGMWFEVDLGRLLVLDQVKISSPGRGFPVGYAIKLSADGQAWDLVAAKPENRSDIHEAFPPSQARYLRVEQTGEPDWPASWMISEITVSATQPWAGAEASHYTNDAHRAIDPSLETTWNTRAVKQKPGMWFTLDMGSLRRIEGITLEHPQNQLPRGYALQVSADGQSWQEVARADDNWEKVDIRFQPTAVRYVRTVTTNSSDLQPWGIAQFVVWRSSPIWLRGR